MTGRVNAGQEGYTSILSPLPITGMSSCLCRDSPSIVPVFSAGDAFSEEANRRFERYPGQTSNQIV